jgi:hypothetical protein
MWQMNDVPENKTHAAVERVIKLEEELEAGGVAAHDDKALATARARLHEWVDSVTATVVSPGLGRVTLIHANGHQSSITSPELPFLMSKPV